MFTSDVDLYLTDAVDGKRAIVKAGDPRATLFLVNAGREIPEKEIETLTGQPFTASFTAPFKAKEKAEDKAVEKSENKGR